MYPLIHDTVKVSVLLSAMYYNVCLGQLKRISNATFRELLKCQIIKMSCCSFLHN